MRKIRLVQFLHDGGEHITCFMENVKGLNKQEVIKAGYIPCTKGKHRRKFIKNIGKYLTNVQGEVVKEELMCWCEWEQPSYFEPIKYSNTEKQEVGFPKYIHTKLEAIESEELRENTDPYIFGDKFYYCVCKQSIKNGSPRVTQKLDKGSVILFGSHKDGEFVLDTVFVINGYTEYEPNMIHKFLEEGRVSNTYYQAGLVPVRTYASIEGTNNDYTLYTGATYDNPVEVEGSKMYSFFPCKPYKEGKGFKKPVIRFGKDVTDRLGGLKFNSKLTQNISTTEITEDDAMYLWQEVVKQVVAQGLCLGVWAEEPK